MVLGTADGETGVGELALTAGVGASIDDGGGAVPGTADGETAVGEVAAPVEIGAV